MTLQLRYLDKTLDTWPHGKFLYFILSNKFHCIFFSNIRVINTNELLALRAGVSDHLEAVQAGRETGTAPAPKEAETSSQEDRHPAGGGNRHCLDDPPAGWADHVLWLICQVDWSLCFVLQGGNRIELILRI